MGEDREIQAMATITEALSPLGEEARARVIRWVCDRFGVINVSSSVIRRTQDASDERDEPEKFEDLASLYTKANPRTDPEKVLVVAYWFQRIQGNKELTAQSVNRELKNLGHGINHITRAFDKLKDQKPQLVIQTHKSGSTRQARKKYKLTQEGIRRVEQMLAGDAAK